MRVTALKEANVCDKRSDLFSTRTAEFLSKAMKYSGSGAVVGSYQQNSSFWLFGVSKLIFGKNANISCITVNS